MIGAARLLFLLPLLACAFPGRDASLSEKIEALVGSAGVGKGKVGILIHSTRAGRVVYARGEREPLLLASNTKLLTMAAALCRLGPDFKFRTVVGTAGGDLHVFGGGDPNISGRFHEGDPTAIFAEWTRRLVRAGVARVGNLVLHTGVFDGDRINPGWKGYDASRWWRAPFGPLSLNDNCVDLTVRPGKTGGPALLSVSPPTRFVTIRNRSRTVAGKSKFGFRRSNGGRAIEFWGEVSARHGKSTWYVPVEDPTAYFGTVLRETLQRGGVFVAGEIRESKKRLVDCPELEEKVVWESGLERTLQVCGRRSQNFYAEMILRVLGCRVGESGTLRGGLAATRGFLGKDVGVEHVSQADGSGLTRENRASASDLVRLLLYMHRHEHAELFRGALASNGASEGTLKKRMTSESLRGRVRAKTGHLSGVSTLSGYVDSLSGDTYVFSILVNGGSNTSADRLQDRICELLIRYRGD
jgi:D-alanyl-D-alanine carboxypeptidase/D-alanyl-D-alanine-endopeptidase (penicillin-binding protein 4)